MTSCDNELMKQICEKHIGGFENRRSQVEKRII